MLTNILGYRIVSEYTLKDDDLINAFLSELHFLSNFDDLAEEKLKEFEREFKSCDEAGWKIDFLIDSINEISVKYGFYFSSHPDMPDCFLYNPLTDEEF